MPLRAIICDIYETLLDVESTGADPTLQWLGLWRQFFAGAPPWNWRDFALRCEREIAADHAAIAARGIDWPEVDWHEILARAAAPFALPHHQWRRFALRHALLARSSRLMRGAASALREMRARGVNLGLCSNAQACSISELRIALRSERLSLRIFNPALRFFSYEHGFAKPSPRAWEGLTRKLAALGIAPQETLHVGDRMDKDILPARAAGWKTWRLGKSQSGESACGGWEELLAALDNF